jgi:transcriptional regulator with XRE-family HTH domain
MGKLREHRRRAGLTAAQAAAQAGMDRGWYAHCEGAQRSLYADTVEKMARGFGLRLELVPESYTDPTLPPADEFGMDDPDVIPSTMTEKFMAQIRAARLARGISVVEASRRAGWNWHQRWSDLERGHTERPSLEAVRTMAEVVGLTLELSPLTEEEREALYGLARWYVRKGGRTTAALASALAKIGKGDGR